MHDTTPFASFLPLNGFIMVLDSGRRSRRASSPTTCATSRCSSSTAAWTRSTRRASSSPYVEHLKHGRCRADLSPAAERGPQHRVVARREGHVRDFVRSHPRTPLPDTLTWEPAAQGQRQPRALAHHRQAGAHATTMPPLDDRESDRRATAELFRHHKASGRVDLVKTGNTVKANNARGRRVHTVCSRPRPSISASPFASKPTVRWHSTVWSRRTSLPC